jgi:eukaryotic-like serine/threonine-protein kinase
MEGMPAEGTGLPVVGTEIAGKYRVEGVLGQGGMGAVYVARNVMTGKRVAIKWLLPEHAASNTRDRLLREAQIASSIDHPNVVDIYDVGEHQGGLFLVMEYLRGKPLSDLLAERGRMDPDELISTLVPAMRGVHAAHMAGVIHRDLKPENIILSESDGEIVPKVVDFGVSKMIGASSVPNASLTRTGALVGTPHYMALEQVDGSNDIDARTDVYAFGVLLYRALTGHYPFDGTSLGEVILKIGTKDAVPMRMLRPDLPPALDAVVLRALSRDRNKRFPDLEDLARSLVQFTAPRSASESGEAGLPQGAIQFRSFGLSSGTHGGSGPRPLIVARHTPAIESGARKRRTLFMSAGAALVLLIAGAFLLRRDPTPVAASGVDTALGAPTATKAPAAPAAGPVEANVAPALQVLEPVVAPGLRMIEGKDEPEDELSPALAQPPQQPVAEPEGARARDGRSALGDKRADKHPAERTKLLRSQSNARTRTEDPRASTTSKSAGNSSALIPGERTNGFSVDEF